MDQNSDHCCRSRLKIWVRLLMADVAEFGDPNHSQPQLDPMFENFIAELRDLNLNLFVVMIVLVQWDTNGYLLGSSFISLLPIPLKSRLLNFPYVPYEEVCFIYSYFKSSSSLSFRLPARESTGEVTRRNSLWNILSRPHPESTSVKCLLFHFNFTFFPSLYSTYPHSHLFIIGLRAKKLNMRSLRIFRENTWLVFPFFFTISNLLARKASKFVK